jgi:hypothetical protein
MNPIDTILIGVMLVVILVMVYFMAKLVRQDPGLWGAAVDKETWQKMWRFGEKLEPEENTALLRIERKRQEKDEEEEEEPVPVE